MEGKVFAARDPELGILSEEVREAALVPGQLEHDLDWVADSDHGQRVTAGALGLYDGNRLAGYIPFRYRTDGLLFRVAGVRLGRVPYRTIELFGRGVVLRDDQQVGEALARLRGVPWPFDALALREVPADAPLVRAIAAQANGQYRTLSSESTVHHLVDLPRSVEGYLSRFSAKSRNTWKRKARKLESECGPLRLRVFTEADSAHELLATIEPVFRLTYHYHLLGRNLSPQNEQLMHNLAVWAQRSWLRAYVLYAGDRPVAYVIGCLWRRRYSYDLPGYDPRLSASSPGILLLLRIIEELIQADAADVLDFGSGQADYKEMLATRSYSETSALLVRRTPYAQGVAYLQRGMLAAAQAGAAVMDRLQLKGQLKTWLRGFRPRSLRPGAVRSSSPNTAGPAAPAAPVPAAR